MCGLWNWYELHMYVDPVPQLFFIFIYLITNKVKNKNSGYIDIIFLKKRTLGKESRRKLSLNTSNYSPWKVLWILASFKSNIHKSSRIPNKVILALLFYDTKRSLYNTCIFGSFLCMKLHQNMVTPNTQFSIKCS